MQSLRNKSQNGLEQNPLKKPFIIFNNSKSIFWKYWKQCQSKTEKGHEIKDKFTENEVHRGLYKFYTYCTFNAVEKSG